MKPNIFPENLPSQLRRCFSLKLTCSPGAWMRVKKGSLKLKLETVEIMGECKFKDPQAPFFSSSSTPPPNSPSFSLEVTSYPLSVYGQRGECLGPSQICVWKP